jgi:hypothetical protein
MWRHPPHTLHSDPHPDVSMFTADFDPTSIRKQACPQCTPRQQLTPIWDTRRVPTTPSRKFKEFQKIHTVRRPSREPARPALRRLGPQPGTGSFIWRAPGQGGCLAGAPASPDRPVRSIPMTHRTGPSSLIVKITHAVCKSVSSGESDKDRRTESRVRV